jgi:tetrahydromethanopterin S-methyltransferase subunit H
MFQINAKKKKNRPPKKKNAIDVGSNFIQQKTYIRIISFGPIVA